MTFRGQRRMPGGQGPARGRARRGSAALRTSARPGRLRRARATPPVAGPARRVKAPQRPRRISGRTAALGLVLIALALAYAYPVRIYLAQQAEIDAMRQSQTQQRERVQALVDQLARWEDPDYVAAQARVRLQLVHAGERIYIVTSEEPGTAGGPGKASPSWLSQLWSSVQAADDPPSARG